MPPRHHYWTIILEGKPTAFRAHTQEELIPTLRQLQARHPDAVLKWSARGRLWGSQEEERTAMIARRRPKAAPAGDRRPRDWRPGGEHKDPRDRFKVPRDEKRRRFAQNLRRDRVEGPQTSDRPRFGRPRPFDKQEGKDRPAPFGASRSDRGAKPPWKRGDRREGDEHAPHPQGKLRRRTPRPPGPRKPGGGNRGGGGQR